MIGRIGRIGERRLQRGLVAIFPIFPAHARKAMSMTRTIARLASTIIDLASEIGTDAEALDGDCIFAAETVICLRDARHLMNQARDAFRLAAQHSEKKTRNDT